MIKTINKILQVLILLLLLTPCFSEAQAVKQDKVRIGITIYPDKYRNGMSEEDAQLITDMLTNELVGNKNFRIYERWQLDAVNQEINIGRKIAMDENTIMKLGKIAGLQYVLIGSVNSLGRREYKNDLIFTKGDVTTIVENYVVNIRVLNVMTGEVHLSFSEEGSAQDTYARTPQISTRQSGQATLKARAIRDAMSQLNKKISVALTKEFAFQEPEVAPELNPEK